MMRTSYENSTEAAIGSDGLSSVQKILARLQTSTASEVAILTTTMPRGGLQIAQASSSAEGVLRAYSHDMQWSDGLTWRAITSGNSVLGSNIWAGGVSEYREKLMRPNDLEFAAAAPLASAVFTGYAGAVHLYRSAAQGDFSPMDMKELGTAALQIEEAVRQQRPAQTGARGVRQFLFNSDLRQLLAQSDISALEEPIRAEIIDIVRRRLGGLNGEPILNDRLQLADGQGDLRTFRAVTFKSLPALGAGPMVMLCRQPDCGEWTMVRAVDFAADPELARMVPAIQFMQQKFDRGPTLVEISRTVQLSPFHFHRRFSELMGLTPKHFMLDCQIAKAKRQLLARASELADIAEACGFAHQSHFTSRFKQATGLTPTRWRRIAGSSMIEKTETEN